MPAIDLTVHDSTDTIIVAAAVITAAGVIWRSVVRPMLKFARRLEKVMENVERQLYPNGGRSLRDAVDRLQSALGVRDHPGPDTDNPNRKEKP